MAGEELDVTAQEDVVPKDGSLQSTIESNFDKVVTPEAPPAAPAPAAAPPERVDRGDGRDASGKFVGKAGEQAPPAAQPQAVPPPAPAATPPPQFAEPPASWKPEFKPFYEKIPNEVRGYLHQREQELQHGFEQVARRGSTAEAVLNEFVPYADQLQADGATPITAIRTLLQTAYQLKTGGPEYKKAIILSLAQQYGVDLTQPMNEQIARAEATAANLLTERMYGSAQSQQQVMAQTQQEFAAFANDPQYEFFPQVRGIMAHLIENGTAKSLPEAYNFAVGMHADVRKTLIDRAVQQHNQAAKQAQAANVSVRGAPNGPGVQAAAPKGESLHATLSRAMENL